jgi:hypothetical protein
LITQKVMNAVQLFNLFKKEQRLYRSLANIVPLGTIICGGNI